ncbi:MAG: hypothetical protein LQ350_008184 [Teloschistes chrysophthalmus]|nr:MAG: hypothetical protein LQ350_008184 [Niorma chrysophthalma]
MPNIPPPKRTIYDTTRPENSHQFNTSDPSYSNHLPRMTPGSISSRTHPDYSDPDLTRAVLAAARQPGHPLYEEVKREGRARMRCGLLFRGRGGMGMGGGEGGYRVLEAGHVGHGDRSGDSEEEDEGDDDDDEDEDEDEDEEEEEEEGSHAGSGTHGSSGRGRTSGRSSRA